MVVSWVWFGFYAQIINKNMSLTSEAIKVKLIQWFYAPIVSRNGTCQGLWRVKEWDLSRDVTCQGVWCVSQEVWDIKWGAVEVFNQWWGLAWNVLKRVYNVFQTCLKRVSDVFRTCLEALLNLLNNWKAIKLKIKAVSSMDYIIDELCSNCVVHDILETWLFLQWCPWIIRVTCYQELPLFFWKGDQIAANIRLCAASCSDKILHNF